MNERALQMTHLAFLALLDGKVDEKEISFMVEVAKKYGIHEDRATSFVKGVLADVRKSEDFIRLQEEVNKLKEKLGK